MACSPWKHASLLALAEVLYQLYGDGHIGVATIGTEDLAGTAFTELLALSFV